jgi:hypothetical protein
MAWRHYWWNMVQRAHGDTLRTLHLEQPRRWMIAIALYLITILLLLAAGAITQAMDQASTGIALVAAFVIVYPVFFCYNLLRAPDRVDQEKSDTIASLEDTVRNFTEDNSQRDAFAQLLAIVISAGNKLRSQPHSEELVPKLNNRIENARTLIREGVGAAEAEVFMSNSGLVSYGDSSLQSQIRITIERRMQRLNELVQRLDRARIRNDFDPEKWRGQFAR